MRTITASVKQIQPTAILEEIASQEKQPKQKHQGVNYDFDKTHEILYPDDYESGKLIRQTTSLVPI